MKGLLVDDRVKVKGTITEVNPDGTYTVELHTSEGYLAVMFETAEVTL